MAVRRVGIVYNAFQPGTADTGERASEESVQPMAEGVRDALRAHGHLVSMIPLRRSVPGFLRRLREERSDIIVNLCEGHLGRAHWESNVAGVFELLQLPFTGSAAKTLARCQDKFTTKAILEYSGLPTAPARLLRSADDPVDLGFPLIVKPNHEDASIGIHPDSVVHDAESLRRQVRRVQDVYSQPVLVETYLDGREFSVAVIEDPLPRALPVSEIDFTSMPADAPRICGYEAKWFEDHPLYQQTPPRCPAEVGDDLREKLQTIALDAFLALECRDYARIDLRTDVAGGVQILEVNPNPDVSRDAGFARALSAAGIAYSGFWLTTIDHACRRGA